METNLAHTGLNTDHARFLRLDRHNNTSGPIPKIRLNPTPRAHTSPPIRTQDTR